jgi:hypothetical protein
MNDKYHEMVFEKTHLSGVEEWYCPSCGRRFLVQWPPAYKMIVLEPGEKDTRHNLSKVNAHRGAAQLRPTEEPEPMEEFRLLPYLRWMEQIGFDSRWSD